MHEAYSITSTGKYKADWGEAPIWWEGFLYYVDTEKHKIIRYNPKSGQELFINTKEYVGTIIPRSQGGLLWAGQTGIHTLNEYSETLTHIVNPEPHQKMNRYSNGKCSPDGRFYVGSGGFGRSTGDAKLFRLDPELSLHVVHDKVTHSNGIAWNKEGDRMFYIDTHRNEVVRFDYSKETGQLSKECKLFSTAEISGSPGGMTIDEQDNLWIAFYHGGCVVHYSQKGDVLQIITLPCRETTSVAFGGHYYEELYVTTGSNAEEQNPNAGRLYVIQGLESKGVPTHSFLG